MLKLTASKQPEPGAGLCCGLRFDIRKDTAGIGRLVYEHRSLRAGFNLGDAKFTVVGGHGAPADFTLRAEDGAMLARAERDRDVYVVDYDGETFIFQAARSHLFFHLRREGAAEVLGRVGRRRLWTARLEADLPSRFATSVQVFLAVLLLDLTETRAGLCQTTPFAYV